MKEITVYGRGGQGVVTAANMVGAAVLKEGKYAMSFPSFGPERRGAPVTAFCRVSGNPIRDRSQVYNSDIVVVLDEGILSSIDITAGLKEDGIIIINSNKKEHEVSFSGKARVICADATAVSRKILGSPMANITILGALCAVTDLVRLDLLKKIVIENFAGSAGEKNCSAVDEVYNLCKGGI